MQLNKVFRRRTFLEEAFARLKHKDGKLSKGQVSEVMF